MSKRWRIHSHDLARIEALRHDADIPAVVAELLVCRGVTDPAAAKVFLEPKLTALHDPDLLPGCARAAALITDAVGRKQRITVFGDYDVDGISGTAILWLCLKLLGAEVGYYVPHRSEEGYGLNAEAIRSLAAEGTKLLITVDCGIGGVEEAALARELGLELIITDHHEPGPRLPAAAAIVHPRLEERGLSQFSRPNDCSVEEELEGHENGTVPLASREEDSPIFAAQKIGTVPLSLRRIERIGRGVETGLGALSAGQRRKTRRPANEGFSGPSRRTGCIGDRGRRCAAGRREPRAGSARDGKSGQQADSRFDRPDERGQNHP